MKTKSWSDWESVWKAVNVFSQKKTVKMKSGAVKEGAAQTPRGTNKQKRVDFLF